MSNLHLCRHCQGRTFRQPLDGKPVSARRSAPHLAQAQGEIGMCHRPAPYA